MSSAPTATMAEPLSLCRLLDPEVLANPYPLYECLRTSDPVYWDPFLHVFVVTRYEDVLHVLHKFSAERTPTPEQLTAMGLSAPNPIAQVMVRQMLFMDAPAHTRLRGIELTLRDVFQAPTVAELADKVERFLLAKLEA